MLRIAELGVATLTRPRGYEAYERLSTFLARTSALELSLDGVTMISMSFMDGIVEKLIAAHELDRITFVTAEPKTRDKLARIAGLHAGASIFIREPDSATRRAVEPIYPDRPDSSLETTKGSDPDPTVGFSARGTR